MFAERAYVLCPIGTLGSDLPKGPCICMVCVWALKGFLNPYRWVCLCTRMMFGPLGSDLISLERTLGHPKGHMSRSQNSIMYSLEAVDNI